MNIPLPVPISFFQPTAVNMRLTVRGVRNFISGFDTVASSAQWTERTQSQYFASTSSSTVPRPLAHGPELSDFLPRIKVPTSGGLQAANGRSVYIETYGCQQNVSDSEIIGAILAKNNYQQAASPETADVLLLNTCSIREKAEAKIYSRLGMLRKQDRNRKGAFSDKVQVIGVLGCMAERLKAKLLDTHKLADIVVGPDAYRDLPRLLQAVQAPRAIKEDAINVQLSLEETYADITPLRAAGTKAAFLSIMRGCNNMCTFCVVPFTRGRERSRPLQSILDEVKMLADQGVRELTLLGQNVNSYADFSQQAASQRASDAAPFSVYAEGFRSVYKPKRGGAVCFGELLDAVAAIDPEMKIWFTSPHPKDFSDEVLDVIRQRNNVAKMVHMPAQSGSSRVLSAMRRGYTREAYDDLARHIRDTIPGVTLSTDMIAGFCGETEEDHAASLDLMQQTAYEQAFMFAYSRRDGTHAARHLEDDVPADVKSRRLNEIIAAFREQQAAQAVLERDRNHLVLVEGEAKSGSLLTGRTANMKRLKFPSEAVAPSLAQKCSQARVRLQAGDYVAVRVTGSSGGNLFAEGLARTTVREYVEAFGSVVPQDCRPGCRLKAELA